MNRVLVSLAFADLATLGIMQWLLPTQGTWFFLVHVGLTFAAIVHWQSKLPGGRSFEVPVIAIGAAFGPCGVLAFTFVRPWSRVSRGTGKLLQAHRLSMMPGNAHRENPKQELLRVLEGRIVLPTADRVESLQMSLKFGDVEARRKALETIVRSFDPRLSPLLAIALTDPDQTIRALAAAASAQINFDVSHWSSEMEASVTMHANDDETEALAMFLAGHGCHDVLLPRAQRIQLCRSTSARLAEMASQLPRHDRRRRKLVSARRAVERTIADFEPQKAGRGSRHADLLA